MASLIPTPKRSSSQRSLRRLRHPHVPPLCGVGTSYPICFFLDIFTCYYCLTMPCRIVKRTQWPGDVTAKRMVRPRDKLCSRPDRRKEGGARMRIVCSAGVLRVAGRASGDRPALCRSVSEQAVAAGSACSMRPTTPGPTPPPLLCARAC